MRTIKCLSLHSSNRRIAWFYRPRHFSRRNVRQTNYLKRTAMMFWHVARIHNCCRWFSFFKYGMRIGIGCKQMMRKTCLNHQHSNVFLKIVERQLREKNATFRNLVAHSVNDIQTCKAISIEICAILEYVNAVLLFLVESQ